MPGRLTGFAALLDLASLSGRCAACLVSTIRHHSAAAFSFHSLIGTDADFREFPAERVTLDSYTLLDATAEVPLSLLLGTSAEPFRVTLWGQNLLDSDYESVVGFAGRGRTSWWASA